MKAMLPAILLLTVSSVGHAGKRDEQVNEDKAALEGDANWIYNDLDKGLATARAEGKPLLVVYRCIP